MRIAAYNVENLFSRARALNLETWADGRPILERYAELNALFEEPVYTDAIKVRMLALMRDLGIEKTNEGKFAILRENRGKLSTYSRLKGARIVAAGRADWIGWVELKTEIINEVATRNTAQVVRDVAPDVLGVVECEGRNALLQFSESLLPAVRGTSFAQAMLIDGNDDRRLLMTRCRAVRAAGGERSDRNTALDAQVMQAVGKRRVADDGLNGIDAVRHSNLPDATN